MPAPSVVVVGLGPAGPDLLAPATTDALASVPVEARFLRTARHPAATGLDVGTTFDHVYEGAASLDEVYPAIASALADAAMVQGRVVYAVPGSPLIAERTVDLLRARSDVVVEVVPALSYLDLAWVALGIDPLAAGVRLVDGHRFAEEAAGERGPLLVAQADSAEVLSEIKLAIDPIDVVELPTVTVLQRLGSPDASVVEVAWEDLDRVVEADHLTTLWIPTLAAPVGMELERFSATVRRLREECPWDRQQTHRSLTPYLLEEAHEAVEAIDALDDSSEDGPTAEQLDHLEEELGDVLFQVVLHSTMAAQEGWFTLADVAQAVDEKLVRRHPHVFAGLSVEDSDEVVRNWDALKKAEKPARTSVFDGIPAGLGALQAAQKTARKGGAGPDDGLPALDEGAVGEGLWALVRSAQAAGVDAESALRRRVAAYRASVEGSAP